MLDHVTRSENQSNDVYRRIEEQLRSVARRLESTERNQSENNRAMSQAASEINVAAREQAQAFDQLGGSVMSLADRLERVERSAANDGTREAIKGLHQGLTRLADQIATTANQSAAQISSLAANMEALAGRLAQARSESQAATRGLDDRIAQLDQRVAKISAIDERLRSVERETTSTSAIDERLSAVERNANSAEDAISQALESIEARKDDDAIARRREAETAGAIARLEENVAKLEARGVDPAIDRRLSGIERSLGEIAGRLDAPAPNDALEDSLKRLAQRVDSAEARQREIAGRLDATARDDGVLETIDRLAKRIETAETRQREIAGRLDVPSKNDAIENNIKQLVQRLDGAEARQRDQIAELRAAVNDTSSRVATVETAPHSLTGGGQAAPFAAPSVETLADPATQAPQEPSPNPDPLALTAPFAAEPSPLNADTPVANSGFGGEAFASAPPPVTDTYLSAARRSARAAAQVEAERASIGGFRWGGAAPEEVEEPATSRKTYIWIAVIVLFVLLAVAAGAVLSQKMNLSSAHSASGLFAKSASSDTTPTGAAAPSAPPAATASATANSALPAQAPAAPPTAPQVPATKPSAEIIPSSVVQPASVPSKAHDDAIATIPLTTLAPPPPAKPSAPLAPLDKLTKLANAGNARAELVVGLKYLDGDGVPASEADAAKWLERAAAQGLAVAQYRLGTLYERGRGVPGDAAKAVHWYQLAAQAGNRKAMHNLAVASAAGTGTPKNLAEAARWFSKAAALGLADSEFNLAVLYERGLGVPLSLLDAYKWYAIAAANGDAESKARIDALATQLSADDRAAAQHAADSFRAQPLDAKANVAPSLNDVTG
jgi:localization factor PodJL